MRIPIDGHWLLLWNQHAMLLVHVFQKVLPTACRLIEMTLSYFNGLVERKIYRKPLIFPWNMGLSCNFSLKPINWILVRIDISLHQMLPFKVQLLWPGLRAMSTWVRQTGQNAAGKGRSHLGVCWFCSISSNIPWICMDLHGRSNIH